MKGIFTDLEAQYPELFQYRRWRSRQGMELPFTARQRKNVEKSMSLAVVRIMEEDWDSLVTELGSRCVPEEILKAIRQRIQDWVKTNPRGSVKLIDELINYYPTCVLLTASIKRRLQDCRKKPGRQVKKEEIYTDTLKAYWATLEYIISTILEQQSSTESDYGSIEESL